MGITYTKFLFCCGISDKISYKRNPLIEYNDRIFYDYVNNPFTFYFGIPDLNIPPMRIDDSFGPNKRYFYTSDHIQSAISIAYENYVSNLTTSSESPQCILLTSYAPDTDHIIMREKPGRAIDKIGY